jgi:polyisoprenoid-binding protein YceI
MSTWQLDSAHTVVSFTAKHMMITKVRGMFSGAAGTIEFDEADPTRSTVEVSIPAVSVDTRNEMRDNHLRSADFLDAESYPNLEFRSTSITKSGDRWQITGDLTIRGTTRPVTLATEYLGIVAGMGGVRHAGFEATTRIKRSDWGLTWNMAMEAGGWMVSDEIALELEVAANEVVTVPEGAPEVTTARA